MASNALDDGQANTSALSTARSDPTVSTNLQRTSDYSVISNTDALTTEFSLTNLLLTANHARLQSNIIGASIALGSWDREGVINIVGGQLKRPAKEETILMREGESTPCQDS